MPRILFRQKSRLPYSMRRDSPSGAQAPSQYIENDCDGREDDELTTRENDSDDDNEQEVPQ